MGMGRRIGSEAVASVFLAPTKAGEGRYALGLALRYILVSGWVAFLTTGAEKKGESTRRQSSQPAHSCVHAVAACTLPGTVPGARDAVVSGAKSLPSRDPHSPGREISQEAITFHGDEGMGRGTGHQAQ